MCRTTFNLTVVWCELKTLPKVVCLFSCFFVFFFFKLLLLTALLQGLVWLSEAWLPSLLCQKGLWQGRNINCLSPLQADDLGDIASWPTPSEIANNEVSVLCYPQDYYFFFKTMLAYLFHTVPPRMCFECCRVSGAVLSVIQDSAVCSALRTGTGIWSWCATDMGIK